MENFNFSIFQLKSTENKTKQTKKKKNIHQ